MATSAFKSTSKRTSIGSSPSLEEVSASANRSHSRSRSLSCFSSRLPEPPAEEDFESIRLLGGSSSTRLEAPASRRLALAIELFDSGSEERGRSALRSSETTPGASPRRGRSVSRHGPRVDSGDVRGRAGKPELGGRVVSESKGNMRQRRSVSIARYQMSDCESDLDHTRSTAKSRNFSGGNNQTPLSRKSLDSNYRPGLRRSLSQKDLKSHDGYSDYIQWPMLLWILKIRATRPFFLKILCEDLSRYSTRKITFISDRNMGLLNVVRAVCPNAPHGFCYRYLQANLSSKFASGSYLCKRIPSLFMRCAYSRTREYFDMNFKKLKEEGGDR